MLLRKGAGDSIRFVDACAGSGGDELGHEGSPVQATRANVIAQAQISGMVDRPVMIHTVAIEKDPDFCSQLTLAVAAWKEKVDVRCGTLDDYIGEFSDGVPTLFFIDPFGLEPLRAELVKIALSGERNEVLALFNDEGALRLLGGTKSDDDIAAELASLDLQPGLFPELSLAARTEAEVKAQKKIAHRAKVRPRVGAILTSTLGDDSWKRIPLDGPTMQRLRALLDRYTIQLRSFGATHVLPMQIRKADGGRAYKLVHATKSAKGFVAMKEAYDSALRSVVREDVFPETVADQLRKDMSVSATAVAAELSTRYAGKRRVPWTESSAGVPSLKRDVLERTAMLPSQASELKRHLTQFKDKGSTLTYSFPSVD